MSNPVSFGANGDPYRGGTFTPGTVPSLNGAFAGASPASNLQSGVTAGTPLLARNNRGSNITIPYARLVAHPAGKTALPPTPYQQRAGVAGAYNDDPITTLGRPNDDLVVETQFLTAGKVCFVLGRRGKNYNGGRAIEPGINGTGAKVPFRQANQLANFATGGSDVNTMQRMCSFEYLQRYFHFVLGQKTFELGAAANGSDADDFPVAAALAPNDGPQKQNGNVVRAYSALGDGTNTMTNVDGAKLLTTINTLGQNADPSQIEPKLVNSGIYFADDGPFLRGKTLDSKIYRIGRNKAWIEASLGDVVAFERLQDRLCEMGACDWTPDGIVHSKLSQGDTILDEELDSRDGQLYNVTVGGPAIASSWTNEKRMEVLPLDKVFVVIVADVWDGKTKTEIEAFHNTDATKYVKELVSAVKTNATPRNDTKKKAHLTKKDGKAVISNLRVRLTTSSEMVSCSALKTGELNQPNTKEAYYDTAHRNMTSRMGLTLSGEGGVSEYIVGGWCIGTVLDSAAARSSHEGATLVGAVKRQRVSHACNVKVGVEFWSADRMYRSFMNVGSGLRTRYNGVQNNNYPTGTSAPTLVAASKRP